MIQHNHTNISARVCLFSCLGLAAASGCSEDTVPVYDVDCEDDAIGWSLDFANLVEPPPAEFPVECASGWGHGVETRAGRVVLELPDTGQELLPHPQGGLLLGALWPGSTDGNDPWWSERLGVEVANFSLAWIDEQAEEIHWLRDDQRYQRPFVVWAEGKAELWAWGTDDGQKYMSRIELSTGELLDRVEWSDDAPWPFVVAAAWPQVGGLWLLTPASTDENFEYYEVQRMSSFGSLGPVLRTHAAPRFTTDEGTISHYWKADIDPTPDGGLLWQDGALLESIAEDGSQRWEIEVSHLGSVVDGHGGFLLGNTHDGEDDDRRHGLSIQRRKLDDGSLLWSRVHHRYDFVHQPEPDQWLPDLAWSYTARADGGYLLGGWHAYPATSCPYQPIVWAIDIDGEVEWAHRVETCGEFRIPSTRVEGRALVIGVSYTDGDTFNTQAAWLQYFDL